MGDEWRHEGKVLTMIRSRTISEGRRNGNAERWTTRAKGNTNTETSQMKTTQRQLTSSRWRTGTTARWFLQRALACAASKRPPVHLYCYVVFHLFINRAKVDFSLLSLQQLQRRVDTRQNSHMHENTQNPRRKTQSGDRSISLSK